MIVLLLTVGILLIPTLVHAWGGATHLEFAQNALAHLAVFAPLVKKLIGKYTNHFLYGSIAADITLGKNLRGYIYNCHNWTVAFDLFENKAKKEHQKAFMLGYMGHLAADTVAHNFFVPYKIIKSIKGRFPKHVFWEMRMDMSVSKQHWQTMEELAKIDFSSNDKLLSSHLKRTFFSFRTNKRIFKGLLFIQQLKHYRKIISGISKKSRHDLPKEAIQGYKQIATLALIDFLKHGDQSYCLMADPTGKIKIHYARDLCRQINEFKKSNGLKEKHEEKLLLHIKQHFQQSIYQNEGFPDVDDFLLRSPNLFKLPKFGE